MGQLCLRNGIKWFANPRISSYVQFWNVRNALKCVRLSNSRPKADLTNTETKGKTARLLTWGEFDEFDGGHMPTKGYLRDYIRTKSDTIPCFRTMTAAGEDISEETALAVKPSLLKRIYEVMVSVRMTDETLYKAQRQGRISFYLMSTGEEASTVGSAAALEVNDAIFSQYREQGALMWRGVTTQDMVNQVCKIGTNKFHLIK